MLIYIGNGAFIPGVPATDLSEEQISALSLLASREELINSGLYAEKTKSKKEPSEDKAVKPDYSDK